MEPPRKKQALSSTEHPSRFIPSTSTLKAELNWTIEQFGSKCKEAKFGESLISPIFHAPGDESTNWTAQLYPNGKNRDTMGYIYLCADQESTYSYLQPNYTANISYTLFDKKKNQLCQITSNNSSTSATRPDHGTAKFFSVENLLVHCKVEYQVTKLLPTYGKQPDLASDISRFLTSTSNGDVTFVIREREFPGHKLILSARSPVFAAMFQHDMKESALNRVEIADIEPDIFQALLRFMYTDQVDLTIEKAIALLAAANRYFLDLLKWKCERFLAVNVTPQNVPRLLLMARAHDAINLKDSLVDFIRKSPQKVMNTEEWNELKKSCPELVIEIFETVFLPA